MAPKGRHQKKTRQSESEAAETQVDPAISPLARCLLNKFVRGALQATDVQEIAHAAWQNGCTDATVHVLSSLGSFGNHPQNCLRDLERRFFKDPLAPEMTELTVPMCTRLQPQVHFQGKLAAFLPHHWLELLEQENQWLNEILGAQHRRTFWDSQNPLDPKLVGSAMLLVAGWQDLFIPVLLHSDSGEFSDSDGLFCISFRSILATGPTTMCQLMITCMPKSCTVKDSHQCIWKDIAASFTKAFEGIPGGKGFRLILWCVAGDMENHHHELQWPSASASEVCGFCPANCSDCPHNDYRDQAVWRQRVWNLAELKRQPWGKHVLFSIPGVNPHMLCLDTLHILELGPVVYAVGTLFFELVMARSHNEQTRVQACNWLWNQVQEAYETLGISSDHRINSLTLSKFMDPKSPSASYPCLHSKARVARYLAPVAALLASQNCDGSSHSVMRKRCLHALAKIEDLVDSHELRMPASAHDEFKSSMSEFLVYYQALSKEAVKNQQKRWSTVPKFHYCCHLVEQAKFLALKACRLYGSEDFIGNSARLGHACLNGTPSHRVTTAILKKIAWSIHLQLNYNI